MDAVQFIKKCQRLARENNVNSFVVLTEDSPETLVKNISDWDREHPGKTRQSELIKIFPNVRISKDGVVDACPINFEKGFKCSYPSCNINYCEDCRTKYWLEEIE